MQRPSKTHTVFSPAAGRSVTDRRSSLSSRESVPLRERPGSAEHKQRSSTTVTQPAMEKSLDASTRTVTPSATRHDVLHQDSLSRPGGGANHAPQASGGDSSWTFVGESSVFICDIAIAGAVLPEPLDPKDFFSQVHCGELAQLNQDITSAKPVRFVAGGSIPTDFVRIMVALKRSRNPPIGSGHISFETALSLQDIFGSLAPGERCELEVGLVTAGSVTSLADMHRRCKQPSWDCQGRGARLRICCAVSGRTHKRNGGVTDREQSALLLKQLTMKEFVPPLTMPLPHSTCVYASECNESSMFAYPCCPASLLSDEAGIDCQTDKRRPHTARERGSWAFGAVDPQSQGTNRLVDMIRSQDSRIAELERELERRRSTCDATTQEETPTSPRTPTPAQSTSSDGWSPNTVSPHTVPPAWQAWQAETPAHQA